MARTLSQNLHERVVAAIDDSLSCRAAAARFGVSSGIRWRRRALTGAILGHANMRTTMIYAHVQHDPSCKAANRVGKTIAAALAGQVFAGGKRKKVA